MKQSINLLTLKTALFQFLHRYHVIIFVLTAIGGLAIATFMINNVLSSPATDTSISSAESFDTQTMDKIRTLRKPGETAQPLELPEGRINPFK